MAEPTDESPTVTPTWLRQYGGLALIVVAGLFFALTSPFNAVTYLPFAGRWVYWSFLIGITWLTHRLVSQQLAGRFSPWLLALLVSVLATPLVLVCILVVQQALDRPVATSFWPSLAASIWVINMALAAVSIPISAAMAGHRPAATDDRAAGPDPAQGLRQRLPDAARNQPIWALCAQDHYLKVFLPDGSHLIHMRFGDAVTMLAGQDGVVVHRSWWVSRAGVGQINREGRRTEITLRTGETVPVSRAGATRLREAGWQGLTA